MANTFKKVAFNVTNARTLVYTCPVSTTTIVFSSHVSNRDTVSKIDHWITVEQTDITQSSNPFFITDQVPVPFGSSLDIGKLALAAGDTLFITGDANSVLDLTINFLEIT